MRKRHVEPARRPVAQLTEMLTEVSGVVVDEPLLVRALTHRSYAYENNNLPHNERQEFLGDAVLGIVVTEVLYRAHPDLPEGQLAKFRAAVVNSRALAKVARQIGLGDFIMLGHGELRTGGRDKDSILADTTEAVIGTVYLCGGLPAAERVVHHLLDRTIAEAAELGAGLDWKTSLQEICALQELGIPMYRISEEGPDHDKRFTAEVVVSQEVLGAGEGRNKKAAEQVAAEQAWRTLKRRGSTARAPLAPVTPA